MNNTMSIGRSKKRQWVARVLDLNWVFIFIICALACLGFAALYSAAGGHWSPWASKQMIRFVPAFFMMLAIAFIDIRFWFAMAWPAWALGIGLLVFVELFGHVGMGAQRWIDLGFMKLQPSELMKIAVVMVLARIYHGTSMRIINHWRSLLLPLAAIGLPVLLIMSQPDLGTSLMIVMASIAVLFLAGLSIWYFVVGGVLVLSSMPLMWYVVMEEYQKSRVLTFLDPERDPFGAGYHITQSKIAIGSGGFDGKGFMEGTQGRLNFLPEKQTDFIFTLWVEEWGFFGGLFIFSLLSAIFIYGYYIALNSKHKFGYLLALGLMTNYFLYAFVNIGMVMGLLPVVGAPLPLVSYGGTSMMAAMISFGLMMSVWLYRERIMPKVD
jgi:rod shape determining protein RodA